MIRMIALMLLACPAAAAAQQLHKCVDAHGHASYQSAPCEANQQQVWVRDATPEPAQSPQATASRRANRSPGAAQATGLPRVPASAPAAASLPISSSTCEAARQRRESTLKAVGLKRNFELLRRLDDAVWNACK